ncbi:MAG: hypothetical protein M3N98_03225 [Actinomycetota bacterium]|nr:hypothetical protein [Actinomycetota bacterium]
MGDVLQIDPLGDDLAALEAEADELAPPSFTDSEGVEREYPADLPEGERDEYQSWWEGQVKANANNHAQPVALVADLSDAHFRH